MRELRDGARFAVEAFAELRIDGKRRRQDFDGDGAIQTRVARLVDLAHPASADGGLDFVRPEPGSKGQRHKCV